MRDLVRLGKSLREGFAKKKRLLFFGLCSNYFHFGGNRLLLLTKNALKKRCQKIWVGPSPPLIWTKSKRTPAFYRKTFSNLRQKKSTTLNVLFRGRVGSRGWHADADYAVSCGYAHMRLQLRLYAHILCGNPHIDICRYAYVFSKPHMYAHIQTNPSICISKLIVGYQIIISNR